jgi:hypothetical protein
MFIKSDVLDGVIQNIKDMSVVGWLKTKSRPMDCSDVMLFKYDDDALT